MAARKVNTGLTPRERRGNTFPAVQKYLTLISKCQIQNDQFPTQHRSSTEPLKGLMRYWCDTKQHFSSSEYHKLFASQFSDIFN